MAKIIVFHPSKTKRIKRALKNYLANPITITRTKN